jgi:hypothetical protein
VATSVSDVEDFIRVLREHPEWGERVRHEVLGEDILTAIPRVAGRRIGPGAAALAREQAVLVDVTGEAAA